MKGEGISDATPRDGQGLVSFDQAFSALESYDSANKTTVHYIRGDAVDSQGRAKHWIFGVRKGQEQQFAIYSAQGLTFIPWNGKTTYPEISVDKIVKPADLIKGHRVVIQEVQRPDITEMELINGVYTLSSTAGGGGKSIRFSALTGNSI